MKRTRSKKSRDTVPLRRWGIALVAPSTFEKRHIPVREIGLVDRRYNNNKNKKSHTAVFLPITKVSRHSFGAFSMTFCLKRK
jgi:hypothetical protein